MKKLSILIIQQSPDLGGAETFMLSLVREFQKNGHSVILGTNPGKFFNEAVRQNIDVVEIPFVLDVIGNIKGLIKSILILPWVSYFYLKLLSKHKEETDVILMSGFSEKMLVSFLSLFFSTPVIWIEYGPLEKILKHNLYLPKILYGMLKIIPRKIIVPSINTKRSLLKRVQIPISKITAIPCGIEIMKNIKKRKYPGWEKNIVIGCTSRLTKEKGQEYILKAIPQIVKKKKNVRFLFVGDGPDRLYLEKLARSLHVEEYVEFVGFVSDATEYYQYMDIFIFSSVWELEGFGLVSIEAMNWGIPVIANNFGPIPEIVTDDVGLKVRIKNPNELTQAILKLCRSSESRKKMGQKGRIRSQKIFDIRKISALYEKTFYDAVSI